MTHSRGFSTLPHECAAMNYASQEIPKDDATTLIPETSDGVNSYSLGMDRDLTNGYIYIKRAVPGESLFLITGRVAFNASATGVRYVYLLTGAAGSTCIGQELNPHATIPARVFFSYVKRAATTDDYFYIAGQQTSGGNLAVTGWFNVLRVR